MIDLVGHKLYLTRKQPVFMKHLQIYIIITDHRPTNITVLSQYQNLTILSLLFTLRYKERYKYLLKYFSQKEKSGITQHTDDERRNDHFGVGS